MNLLSKCWSRDCAHLQQLHVDQLLWTRRLLNELFAQRRPLHLPLLLVGELERRGRGGREKGEAQSGERGVISSTEFGHNAQPLYF